jgi:LemA protein
MKTSNIILLVFGAALILLLFNGCSSYNNMVNKQETTSSAWAQVENVYQRRADLIPNLVNTVKGVANFEQKTLTDVINARASASQMKVDASKLSADQIQKFQASQGELSQALGRLMVVAEQYPQLKATDNFKELQSQRLQRIHS